MDVLKHDWNVKLWFKKLEKLRTRTMISLTINNGKLSRYRFLFYYECFWGYSNLTPICFSSFYITPTWDWGEGTLYCTLDKGKLNSILRKSFGVIICFIVMTIEYWGNIVCYSMLSYRVRFGKDNFKKIGHLLNTWKFQSGIFSLFFWLTSITEAKISTSRSKNKALSPLTENPINKILFIAKAFPVEISHDRTGTISSDGKVKSCSKWNQ